jgi:hypothetical protein
MNEEGDAVTEAKWLACTDAAPMLEFIRGRASDRKLRLFACGCVRRAITVNTFSWWGNAIELPLKSESVFEGTNGPSPPFVLMGQVITSRHETLKRSDFRQ